MTAYSWEYGDFSNDSGAFGKYNEFGLTDFDENGKVINGDDRNDIEALFITKETKMDGNKGSRKASYVGELTSGYDATKGVNDYEAGQNKQIGKKHEEEVDSPNWHNDKRNEIGKAATKSAAMKLRKIADALEKMADGGFDKVLDGANALSDYHNDNDILVSGSVKQALAADEASDDFAITAALELLKKAEHPIDHAKRDDKDVSGVTGDSQMGDDEWVDIGPGEFKDTRDEVGRAEKSGQ